MNFSVNPKKTTETNNFSTPQEVSPTNQPSVRLSLKETNQTALEAGITASIKSNLQGSTSSSKLATTEQSSFLQASARSLTKMLLKVKETLSNIKHSLTDTAEVKSLKAHVHATNDRIATLRERKESFLGDIREQERLKAKSSPSVRETLSNRITDFNGKIDEIDKQISELYAENEKHQSEIIETRRTRSSSLAKNESNFFESKNDEPHPLITPDNIFKILRQLTTNTGSIENIYKKYGPNIANPKYLLNQIKQIPDDNQRKAAMKVFLSFQANMVGHSMGFGGLVKFKQKALNALSAIGVAVKSMVKGAGIQFNMITTMQQSNKTSLEGQWQTNTHLKMTGSLHQFFVDSNVGKALPQDDKTAILSAFENSLKLDGSDDCIEETLKDIQAGKLVTIATGWVGHATEVTIKGDYLCYSNRGQRSKEWGENGSGIQIYKMTKPMTKELLSEIIKSPFSKSFSFEKGSSFFENPNDPKGIIALLGLEPQGSRIKKQDQKVGNCAWASTKCAFQACLLLLEMEKQRPSKMEKLNELLDKAALNQLNESEQILLFKACMATPEGSSFMAQLADKDKLSEKLTQDPSFRKNLLKHFEIKVNSSFELQDNVTEKFSAWNMEHRAAESTFFVDLLRENNANEEFISKHEELKLLGQLASKLYTKSKQDKYNKIEDGAGARLHEITRDVLSAKEYSVWDAIVKIKTSDSQKIDEIAKKSISKQPKGAFCLFEDQNGKIHLFIKKDKVEEFEFERDQEDLLSVIDEKGQTVPLSSFKDLVEFVKAQGTPNAFFVHNAKDIENVLRPKENLD